MRLMSALIVDSLLTFLPFTGWFYTSRQPCATSAPLCGKGGNTLCLCSLCMVGNCNTTVQSRS